MSAFALTNEAIAFTEKKVDMALDDIIKMSKDTPIKPYKKQQRVPNKSHKPFDGTQNKALRVRQYMDSRASVRQGALAQRRTNFQGNNFPMVIEAAKNAVVAPVRNRGFSRNRAANWNRSSGRATVAVNQQRLGPARGFVVKPRWQQQQHQQQQQQQQQHPQQRQQHPQQRQQQSQPQTIPKTLDSLFASMKEQRMKTFGRKSNAINQTAGPVQQRQPWGRGQRNRH